MSDDVFDRAVGSERGLNKEAWGRGPWDDEPDRIEWRYDGFPCLMVRNHMGVWCGYVALPPGHRYHGAPYDRIDASAHGGLTFANKCGGEICHTPEPGESDDVWWVGFDCCHAGDLWPASAPGSGMDAMMDAALPDRPSGRAMLLWGEDTYRDQHYVRAEVESLARQLR